MRKCLRCQIVFHSDKRLYCLYCNGRLLEADVNEIMKAPAAVSQKEKFLLSSKVETPEHTQYLMGTYFRKKSFPFTYSLNRNQFKMGSQFAQLLVQPVDFSFFIRIPWIVINLLDSFFLRIVYSGFCQDCGWKCRKMSSQIDHSKEECEYNREYSAILQDILSGKIIRNELSYESEATQKIRAGKKSAYYKLCERTNSFVTFVDLITIFISIAIFIYIVVGLAGPLIQAVEDFSFSM